MEIIKIAKIKEKYIENKLKFIIFKIFNKNLKNIYLRGNKLQ